MARTALVASKPLGGYPALPLAAGSALLTLAAADTVNNNSIPSTGRELIVVYNSGGSAYTVTIHSSSDPDNRTGDITTYSIPAGTEAMFGPFPMAGWRQADGNLWIDGSNAALLIGAVILPVF